MKTKISFSVIILILSSAIISSQTLIPRIEWYKIYDGPGHYLDLSNDVKSDYKNNIYICGASAGKDSVSDLVILKYSSKGDSLLELRYSSEERSYDEALSMAVDAGSNMYVIGNSTFDQSTFYAVFQKYSPDGKLSWWKYFYDKNNVDNYSQGVQVILNSKDEPVISYIEKAAMISKYTPTGDSVWTVSFKDDTSSFVINYLAVDKNDNIYAAIQQSYWAGSDVPESDLIFVKISDSGEILWQSKTMYDSGTKIILDNGDNPVIIANGNAILKFSPSGEIIWEKNYADVGGIVVIMDLLTTSDNEIIYTGYGLGEQSWDYYTGKLSYTGDELWVESFDSDEQLKDYAFSAALDKENNIYITGGTHNSISEGYCYTLKYSTGGELKWKIKFDAPHSIFENGSKVFVDDSNNVYVGGDVVDSLYYGNYLVFKIKQEHSTGVGILNNYIPSEFTLSQNYPNPFNPTTKFNFTLPERDNIKIAVYDVLGRLVSDLYNGELSPGSYTMGFNASDLSSGIYYYKLSTSNNNIIKKAVLLK